jgi:hypothetical protein
MYMKANYSGTATMQKAQVFLRDDQKEQLKAIATRTGTKQSELIRRGVDMVIEVTLEEQTNWKSAWKQASGVWKDRDDIETTIADNRARLNARFDRLNR